MSALLKLLNDKKAALASRNRAKTSKIPDGRSRWRILPSWRGAEQQFWHDFGAHYIKNAAEETQAVYICTNHTFGRPCNICDAVSQGLKGAMSDAEAKVLTQAKANPRVLVNALQLDGPSPGTVQILELAPTAFGMIVDIATEWLAEEIDILSVTAGKDLVIERSGTGKSTKYSVQVGAKDTKINPDVIKQLHNLDAYVAQESAEQEARALGAVRQVAGLLPAPAPAAAAVSSRAPVGAHIVDDDDYAVATPPKRAVAAKPAEDAVPVKPRAAAPAPAPAEAPADLDMDALIADLGLDDPQ
jgi:hypothetical protein